MIKKLSLFLVSALASMGLQAQGDVSLKYGLTSIDNDPSMKFKNHTIAGDITFDMGSAIKPRIDLSYVSINDSDKWGGVSALVQGALSAQYSKTFDMVHFPHEFYLFGGLGYEYVVDGYDKFDSLPYFQAGIGAKYGITEGLNLLTEFRAMQVFDSNNDSDDEDNEFALFVGLNFPFGYEAPKAPRVEKPKEEVKKVEPKVLEVVNKEKVVVAIIDSDKDGVEDSKDQCPDTVLKENMIIADNGCPILLDSDDDGITDDIDQCENTPAGVTVDAKGCQAAVNLGINFESNSATITADSMAKIKKFATYLKSLPEDMFVVIEGYTDSSGDAKKNRALSSRRAFAVRKALINEGVAKRAVRAYGRGSQNPIADNDTVEGRAKNRRIEATIKKRGE